MKGNIVAEEQLDLENMDDEEFMDAWTEASQEAEAAKERCKAFAAEQRRRDAKARLDQMSPEERQFLAQFASADGIDSEESVQNG